jgi:hypothetical protein
MPSVYIGGFNYRQPHGSYMATSQTAKDDTIPDGRYDISAMWDLYVSGNLHTVYVDCIDVSQKDDDEYSVKHYGRSDRFFCKLTLTREDIGDRLSDKEPQSKPYYVS